MKKPLLFVLMFYKIFNTLFVFYLVARENPIKLAVMMLKVRVFCYVAFIFIMFCNFNRATTFQNGRKRVHSDEEIIIT